jgi:tetratricopeptide (TPR) repeat protein
MKLIISLFLLVFISSAFAQNLSYEDFMRETKFNKRLLPKQGSTTKSDDQLEAEKAYVEKMKETHASAREASNKLVDKGYKQLKEDPREAMYSFNNAYLVDSSNAKVYWGYGELYSNFKQFDIAEAYFKEGLYRDGKDVHLLNSLARNYQNKYSEEELNEFLEQSIGLLDRSLKASIEEPETYMLLTKAYLKLGNCDIAKDYFKDYSAIAGEEKKQEMAKVIAVSCK